MGQVGDRATVQARTAVVRRFVLASVGINTVWFLFTLVRHWEWWAVTAGGFGVYGQGALLAVQVLVGERLARPYRDPAAHRMSAGALNWIVVGQPVLASAYALVGMTRQWGSFGAATLLTFKTVLLGSTIAFALRRWSGRPSAVLALSVVVVNVLWPMLPWLVTTLGWAYHLPGVFRGRSDGWLNPLLTAFWHVPQCALAGAWLSEKPIRTRRE